MKKLEWRYSSSPKPRQLLTKVGTPVITLSDVLHFLIQSETHHIHQALTTETKDLLPLLQNGALFSIYGELICGNVQVLSNHTAIFDAAKAKGVIYPNGAALKELGLLSSEVHNQSKFVLVAPTFTEKLSFIHAPGGAVLVSLTDEIGTKETLTHSMGIGRVVAARMNQAMNQAQPDQHNGLDCNIAGSLLLEATLVELCSTREYSQ